MRRIHRWHRSHCEPRGGCGGGDGGDVASGDSSKATINAAVNDGEGDGTAVEAASATAVAPSCSDGASALSPAAIAARNIAAKISRGEVPGLPPSPIQPAAASPPEAACPEAAAAVESPSSLARPAAAERAAEAVTAAAASVRSDVVAEGVRDPTAAPCIERADEATVDDASTMPPPPQIVAGAASVDAVTDGDAAMAVGAPHNDDDDDEAGGVDAPVAGLASLGDECGSPAGVPSGDASHSPSPPLSLFQGDADDDDAEPTFYRRRPARALLSPDEGRGGAVDAADGSGECAALHGASVDASSERLRLPTGVSPSEDVPPPPPPPPPPTASR